VEYDFKTFTFTEGEHKDRAEGMCIMEAVAYVAGEPHSDMPACASPVLSKFMQGLNDKILNDDMRRDWLGPFVFRLAGTVAAEHEQRRWIRICEFGYRFARSYKTPEPDPCQSGAEWWIRRNVVVAYHHGGTDVGLDAIYEVGRWTAIVANIQQSWPRVCRFISRLIRVTEIREVVPRRKEPTHA